MEPSLLVYRWEMPCNSEPAGRDTAPQVPESPPDHHGDELPAGRRAGSTVTPASPEVSAAGPSLGVSSTDCQRSLGGWVLLVAAVPWCRVVPWC